LALFRVLKKLDENGSPLSIVGYAWGDFAWALATAPGSATVTGALLSKTNGLLDQTVVAATLNAFPWERTFTSTLLPVPAVYDPAFVLPVLLHASGSLPTPGCKAFADSGALQLALCALACADNSLRAIAYAILSKFSIALGYEVFNSKPQLELILGVLRNSIIEQGMRLPACHAVFLSRAIPVLLRPEHSLYHSINVFLLSSPRLNFNEVPLVSVAFSSVNPDSISEERKWILHALCASIGPKNVSALPSFTFVALYVFLECHEIHYYRHLRTSGNVQLSFQPTFPFAFLTTCARATGIQVVGAQQGFRSCPLRVP
jgi:hypothetical protein